MENWSGPGKVDETKDRESDTSEDLPENVTHSFLPEDARFCPAELLQNFHETITRIPESSES